MNRCHKILQDIYYSLHANDLVVEELGCEEQGNIVTSCMRQWTEIDAPLTFPSKSINVAVIYARLLEHHFKSPAVEYLQDPLLLHGNDRFYKPYAEYSEHYDKMLQFVTYDSIVASTNPSVKKTVECFNKEFLVGSCEFMMFTKCRK